MMGIDWSKMPRGATHYREDWHCTSTGGVQYYKKSEEKWAYWGELLGPGWRECEQPILGFKEIPNKVTKHPIWEGEGLPPVGLIVEAYFPSDSKPTWLPTVLLYVSEENVIYSGDEEGEEIRRSRADFNALQVKFRTIRTAEQIAAEEREALELAACVEIEPKIDGYNVDLDCSAAIRMTIHAMIEAGYRKVHS